MTCIIEHKLVIFSASNGEREGFDIEVVGGIPEGLGFKMVVVVHVGCLRLRRIR